MKRNRHLSLVRHDGFRTERELELAVLVSEVSGVLASTTGFRGALPRTLEVLCEQQDALAAHAWVRRPRSEPVELDLTPWGTNGDGPRPSTSPWRHLWHPNPMPRSFLGFREAVGDPGLRPERREAPDGEDSEPSGPGCSPAAVVALASRSVVRIEDLAGLSDGAWKSGIVEAGVKGLLALPILARDLPVAVFEIFFSVPPSAAEVADDETLSLIRSQLELRAEYDRMSRALDRSARLWQTMRSRLDTRNGGASAGNGSGSTFTLLPSGSEHAGLYDHGTGLPTWTLFLDRVRHTLGRRTRQPDRWFAILLFELEFPPGRGGNGSRPHGSRAANGTTGTVGSEGELNSHPEIMARIGRQLDANVRPGDCVGHLSGSGFGVLVENMSNRADVVAVARRLEANVRDVALDLLAKGVQLRVGLALSRPAHEDAEDVVDEARADAARDVA